MFGYQVNRRSVSCIALPVSLPGEEMVIYDESEDATIAAARSANNALNQYFNRPDG
jgi:hypothetical protein